MHGKTLIPLLLLSTSSCVAPRLDLRAATSRMGLSGDFGATDTTSGTGANARSDFNTLGLGREETAFQPRLDFDWVGPHVMVSTMSTDFSGTGTAEGEIEIGGGTIGADVDVDTDLGIDAHRLAFTWDFVPTTTVDAGIGIGATVLDIDLRMQEIGGAGMVESDESFPVPTIAGRAALQLGRFGASLDLGWLNVSVSDADVTILDYELAATYDVLGRGNHLALRLMAGYRGLDIDAEYEDDDAEVDLNFLLDGFLFGLTLSF